MIMQTAINLLMQISAIVVLFHAMGVINTITAKTCHLIRIAYPLIATAALTGVLAPMFSSWQPHFVCSVGMFGIAILFTAERRRIVQQSQKTASIHVIHKQQGRAR